jgi:2',3'-cyclic-nucleotide 2'-phosphodiesterase (5'-nucleotidase family)
VPDIDITLGGHTHTRPAEHIWVGNTLMMQTGAHGKALGRADILIERQDNGRVRLSINGREGKWWGRGGGAAPLGKPCAAESLIDATSEVPHDVAVLASYTPFPEKILRRDAEVVTSARVPLTAEGADGHQIALGTLLADAVRKSSKSMSELFPAAPFHRACRRATFASGTR